MPELPEVQNVVDSLRPLLCGRKILDVRIHRTDILTPADADWATMLTARTVQMVTRRGKRIYLQLNDGNRLFVHLGMTGRLRFLPLDAPTERHTHVMLSLDGAPPASLRFTDPRRFGGIFWVGSQTDDPSLGPEPLEMSWRELWERLTATSRSIKAALLDQQLIAGLGNIYVDEALHLAQIRPTRIARRLTESEMRQLQRSISRVLKSAIAAGGSTLRDYVNAQGAAGSFQNLHRVYGRANRPCLRCSTPIRRILLGGRSTHFCPACQNSRRRSESEPRRRRA